MRVFARAPSESFAGIEIRGGSAFRTRTRAALELLRSRPCFATVRKSIAVIREGKRSGMWARKSRPTFVVGAATWNHSERWYAGAIAHDAYHAKLYVEAKAQNGGREPDSDAWTGADAEKNCLAFQREVLAELDAGAEVIAYVRSLEKNPVYQGRNRGWKGWLDYLRRRW